MRAFIYKGDETRFVRVQDLPFNPAALETAGIVEQLKTTAPVMADMLECKFANANIVSRDQTSLDIRLDCKSVLAAACHESSRFYRLSFKIMNDGPLYNVGNPNHYCVEINPDLLTLNQ